MRSPEPNEPQRKVKIWVKLFVLFHLICITIWALPNPPKSISERRVAPAGTQWIPYLNQTYLKSFPPLTAYLFVTGFWQYWDMFAPNPAQTDQYGDADVIYRDGSVKHYGYPRMFTLPIGERYLKERYRKFYERSGKSEYKYFWPPFALRIALLNDNPNNPPVAVKLYHHWRDVAGPGLPQRESYKSEMYFEYAVDLHELERLRGIH